MKVIAATTYPNDYQEKTIKLVSPWLSPQNFRKPWFLFILTYAVGPLGSDTIQLAEAQLFDE
jgi:hypothetical protein